MKITIDQAELYQKWADVCKMCVGTEVDPRYCMMYDNEIWGAKRECLPAFDDTKESYQFALCIVENRPVFVGDELFNLQGDKVIINGIENKRAIVGMHGRWPLDNLSWNKPIKTIEINGRP